MTDQYKQIAGQAPDGANRMSMLPLAVLSRLSMLTTVSCLTTAYAFVLENMPPFPVTGDGAPQAFTGNSELRSLSQVFPSASEALRAQWPPSSAFMASP